MLKIIVNKIIILHDPILKNIKLISFGIVFTISDIIKNPMNIIPKVKNKQIAVANKYIDNIIKMVSFYAHL